MPTTNMKVLLTADDFGLTDAVSACIAEMLAEQVISRTSVMVCEPFSQSACRTHIGVLAGRAGCHLQIHGCMPVSPIHKIPSLVGDDGILKGKDDFCSFYDEDVFTEWCMQVEKCYEFGFSPTHVDTHHHVHSHVRFFDVLRRVSERYDLPIRRSGIDEVDSTHEVPFVSEGLLMSWTLSGSRAESLVEELLHFPKRTGIVEVVCHPGYSDDQLRKRSSASEIREFEAAEVRRLPGLLHSAGIGLLTCPH